MSRREEQAHGPAADPDGTHVCTDARPAPGKNVGSPATPGPRRYRAVRLHARGSLGEVHVARDEELNREVALKELQDHCADHIDSRLRFLREAEITAALEHPCIVPVYGRGHHPDGRPYYAMRFVRGQSLEEAIKRHFAPQPQADPAARTLAFRDLLTRFVAVCQAVAYAHSRGVIHRDLKPGNVMLGPFGETLVVDWGLARHFDRPDPEPPSGEAVAASPALSSTATHDGQVVGTPAYMSPEQAGGRRDLGPASDIYSLGGILYAILTGQPPISRALGPVLLMAQLDRTPPAPRLVNRAVPRGLEAVCLKAMARSPEDRYRSADELAREVQRWLADEPVAARPEPLAERGRRWSRRHRTAVAGLAALLLTATVALAVGLAAVSREQARTTAQRDEAIRAEKDAEASRELAEKAHARAEENYQKAERALGEAKRSLEQADRNLQLARKAVDETFKLTTTEPLLMHENAAPFRRRVLKATLPYYREFQALRPGDPAFDLDLARNLARVATIESHLGEHDEARAHAGKARELCAAAARREKLSADDLQELAECLNNVGSVYHARGELKPAIEAITEARAIQQRVLKERPGCSRGRLHLLKMTYNLGLTEWSRDRPAEALKWLDRSLELEREALLKNPENAELLGVHVGACRTRGTVLQGQERFEEAHKAYLAGEEAGDRLLKEKVSADHLRTVATTYSDHAAMRSNQGKPAEALPLFRKAIKIQEGLCRQQPETRFYHDLGIMTSNLGRVCYLLRRPDEELAAWDRARRTWAEILARRPRDEAIGKHHGEAWAHWARAKVYQIDRLTQGDDPFAAAREIERLASESPSFKPGLVAYAAACGRWLNAFAKDARLNEAQRGEVRKQAVGFLTAARREGVLDEKAAKVIREDRSFEPLRGDEAVKKLLAQIEKVSRKGAGTLPAGGRD